MERLARQVSEARRALSKADEDWKKAVDAVKDLADAFEALGRGESVKDAARLLLPIASEIGLQVNSSRSAAVRDTCKSVTRILAVTGRYFSDVANALMPAVAGTAKGSSAAIRKPGADLFARMSELTRYDLQLLKSIYLKDKAHERVCSLLLEQIAIVLVYWTLEEAAPYFADLAAVVDAGLHSGSEIARRAARDAVVVLAASWPDRIGELRDIPPQQRVQLVVENPDSRIATTLLEQYADLADKVQRFQVLESKKPSVRQRANSRRVSSTTRKETFEQPAIAIERKEPRGSIAPRVAASPDRSSEGSMSEEAAEFVQSPADRLQPVSKQSVQDDDTAAIPVLDRKPEIIGLAVADIHDNSLSPQVPPEFDGSQMHGFTLRQSETQAESRVKEDLLLVQPLLAEATCGIGAQRSSVRSSNVSRIPRRVPPRSSSIPLPTPRIRSEAPASRISLPPIEFSGLSVTSIQDAGEGDDGHFDEESKAPIVEEKPHGEAGLVTSVPIGAGECEPNVPAVAERDLFRANGGYGDLAGVPADDERVAERSVLLAAATAAHGPTPISARETSEAEVDVPEKISTNTDVHAGIDNWFAPTTRAASSINPDAKKLAVADDTFAETTPDANLMYAELQLQDAAATQILVTDNTLAEDFAVKSSVIAPFIADTSLEEVSTDDSMALELQQHTHDIEADTASGLKLGNGTTATNSEASSTAVTGPPPKGALERLQEVRQQYADLRSLSKFDVRDLPVDSSPEVLEDDKITALDEPNPARLDENDVAVLQSDHCTELADLEGLDDADAPGRILLPIEPATLVSVERDARPRLSVIPSAPSRITDTRQSRRTTATARRDRSQNRSRESSRERRAESGERGSNAAAVVRERPLIRKKSIPNLLKGVRLKFEDKPAAQLLLGGDTAVPRTNQDQLDSEVPAMATKIVDAALCCPELPAPAATDEVHWSGFVADEESTALMTPEPLSIPTPRVSIRTMHMNDNNGAKLLNQSSDAAAESPEVTNPRLIDTSAAESYQSSTLPDVEHARPPRASPYRLVQEDVPQSQPYRRVPTPTKARWGLPAPVWTSARVVWFWLMLGMVFGGSGLLRAVTTVRETYEYHQALKLRIDRFEVSVAESHETVHKLEENYAVWSEYVRVLAEEDEANAVAHLEMVQQEVEKWQRDMKADLLEFRRSLSAEGVDAVLAPLLHNATQGDRGE